MTMAIINSRLFARKTTEVKTVILEYGTIFKTSSSFNTHTQTQMFIYIKIFIIINYIERQQTKKYQLEVKLLCVEESN